MRFLVCQASERAKLRAVQLAVVLVLFIVGTSLVSLHVF